MVRRTARSGARNGAPGLRPRLSGAIPNGSLSTNSATPQTETPPTSIDDEVNGLDIASLTIDVPTKLLNPRRRAVVKPFHFLLLPSEIRIRIYEYFFEDAVGANTVLDLGPDNYKKFHRKLGLMRVCRLIHSEASHVFYNTATFRLFPTHPGRYFKSKYPLLSRLRPEQRALIGTLELRLGPGWGAPPRGWVVNDGLGLSNCVNAHKLNVFVECDPSDGFYKGFRRADGFYENFCKTLLTNVINAMPALQVIEFDGNPGVTKHGGMMTGLLEVASLSARPIKWGPQRGWTDADDDKVRVVKDDGDQSVSGPANVSVLA
jgi:hypothetical protein